MIRSAIFLIYVKRHNRFIDIWKRIWDVNALWADRYFICNVWNVTVEILRIQCKSRSRKKVTLNIKCVYWSLFMVLKCPNCHVIHSRDANENTYFFIKNCTVIWDFFYTKHYTNFCYYTNFYTNFRYRA